MEAASSEADDPKILLSLVVSTRGRRAELARLLASLAEQSDRRFEVIVVDQNELGYLDEVLAASPTALRCVPSRPGLSLGRNTGLSIARGKIVGFPDDDCWYQPDAVRSIVNAFDEDHALGVLLGRTLDTGGRESLGHFLPSSRPVDRFNVWRAGNSNSLFVRRSIAQRIDGFDEELGVGAATPFQSGEETDFILRALADGEKVMFRHEIIIHHDQVEDAIGKAQIDRARRYSRGYGRVLRKHRYPIIFVMMRLARPLGRSVLAFITFTPRLAIYKAVWALGTARGYLAPLCNPAPTFDQNKTQDVS